MTISREVTIRILEAILGPVEKADQFPDLARHKETLLRLRDELKNTESANRAEEELWDLFNDHAVRKQVVGAAVYDALKFINEHLDHFRQVKLERPLTEQERQFMSDHLWLLLQRCKSVVEGKRKDGRNEGETLEEAYARRRKEAEPRSGTNPTEP